MVLLSLSASAVDAGGSLGRITTHESVCIEVTNLVVREGMTERNAHPCLSRRRTLPPRSRRVCAAERPARPPPTTITCAMGVLIENAGRGRANDERKVSSACALKWTGANQACDNPAPELPATGQCRLGTPAQSQRCLCLWSIFMPQRMTNEGTTCDSDTAFGAPTALRILMPLRPVPTSSVSGGERCVAATSSDRVDPPRLG
jgi:hypothetical protein